LSVLGWRVIGVSTISARSAAGDRYRRL